VHTPPGGFLCRWLCKKNNKKNIHTYTPKHPKHVFCVCVCVWFCYSICLNSFLGMAKKNGQQKKRTSTKTKLNRLCGSKWATTGKQYWRRGMNRKHIFRVTVLAHVRSQKGCCLLVIAGRWPWRLESAQESCNNSPAEACISQNGWRQSQRETKTKL